MMAARKASGGQSIALPFREGENCGLDEVSRRSNCKESDLVHGNEIQPPSERNYEAGSWKLFCKINGGDRKPQIGVMKKGKLSLC
jgi:hypothetical protein